MGLDLSVVIVGVVLGFQITEWNESRQLQARENAALQRLHEETADVVMYLRRTVSAYDGLTAEQDRAVASLSDGSWPETDPEVLASGLSSLIFYPAIAPPRSVYDELLGSGVFADISSPAVRAAVATYYSELDFIQGQLDYFRAGIQSDRQLLGNYRAVRYVYDPDLRARMRVVYDFGVLANDPSYMSTLVGQLRNQLVFQGYRRSLLELAEAMRMELERAVGDS